MISIRDSRRVVRTAPFRTTGSTLLVVCVLLALGACVSSFRFEPVEGHPARADTAPSAPPPSISPADYEPPEAEGADSGGAERMGSGTTDRREDGVPLSEEGGR